MRFRCSIFGEGSWLQGPSKEESPRKGEEMSETVGRREQIERMIGQMVKSGQKPEYARKVAREQAIKQDKRDQRK